MLGTPKTDRRTARREATRAEILDAAWDLVREEGLAALSLRDLAARVGMRAPSLYSYFDSKHAIYDAMFGQAAQEALETQTFEFPDAADAAEELLRGARAFFDWSVSDPARSQLLFQRSIPGFEPSPESYAPAVEMIDRLTAAFRARGITEPDAVDLWTAMLSGLINQQLANDPGGNRWGRLLERNVDMFLAGVGPKPRKRGTR